MAYSHITTVCKGDAVITSYDFNDNNKENILKDVARGSRITDRDGWTGSFRMKRIYTSGASLVDTISFEDPGVYTYLLGKNATSEGNQEQDYFPEYGREGSIGAVENTYDPKTSSNYELVGFVLCFVEEINNNYIPIYDNTDACALFQNSNLEVTIDWSKWADNDATFPYYTIGIFPVYKSTETPTDLTLEYASPIVINRSPASGDTATHIIKSETGYSGNVFLKNQPGFLYYLEEDDDGIYSSYEEQEQEAVGGGKELVKVVKVPSNQYLASQDYGVVVTGGSASDSETMVLSKNSSNSMTIRDGWKEELDDAGAGIKFIVDLLGEELDTFTRLNDTKAYKFLGICVYYTAGDFETGYTHKGNSDRCYFISKNNFDAAGQATFTILYRGTSTDDVLTSTEGVLHLAPVFEAQREIYLTEPIVVGSFPSFSNITDLGSFGKDTSIPIDSSNNIEFGYTDGIQNANIFISNRGNFSGLCNHSDYFNPTVSVDAGFVELFGSWSGHVSGAWKQNMTSNGSFVSQTYLGWNQISYDKDSQRTFSIHSDDTYINTAETDNNSLYLYIHGTCSDSNIVPPSYSEGMTVQDYQAKCNGCEMIGFIVYFKEGAELDDIEKWRDPSDGSSYAPYFTPVLWEGGSFSAKIKIDLYGENGLNDLPFENYLAISPVYLKTDTKTITLGCAQDSAGGDLSDYVSTYTVSVTIGDNPSKQYSQGDSIEVSEGDTITITLASSESGEWYAYSETFAIGGKTYSDGASVEYDDIEDGDEFHPIFSYTGETFTFKNDTARSIQISFNGSTTQINPWEEMEFMDSSPGTCEISILTPSNTYMNAYSGAYGENAYDLISGNSSFWGDTSNNTTQYQANLYVSVPSKGIDIYKLDFYQGNGSCSVLTNSDSDVAVRFVALPWDAQSAETYHLSQFINSLGDEDFKEFYLRGKLPMNLNAISYSSNKKFKSMKCETAHVVPIESNGETNEPSHDLRDIYIRENVGFDIYYIDKVSDIDSIRDTWTKNDGLEDETNGTRNTLAETVKANADNGAYDEYGVFTGNGVYNFIIKGSEINAEDKSTYDYEIYNCGPLVGYVEEQDSNTPVDDEDEFFLGVTQPGSEVVTAFGWETVEGERQLMTLTEYDNTEESDGTIKRPFYAPNIINPGSWSDSSGTYNDDPTGPNYTTTENEVTGSLMSMEEMPKDYCAFQTGNQFIQFRLRNPYDGSVLNFDEKSAYTLNKGVWQKNVSTASGTENETMLSDTTHEQTNFLTLWEQRSLFNALNGKPTYVNEVISYITYTEKEVEDMALNADTASADNGASGSGSTDGNYCFPDTVWYDAYLKGVYGLRDANGNIVTPLIGDPDNPTPNPAYHPDEDIEFVIPARNGRKAGRALVDNIDDWVQWYKREETAGVIAGGNTSAPGGTPVMFVGPLLNKEKELCIESDATRSNLTLGPGESITVPIVVLYKCYEADGRDSCKYTVGFDLRNSQYQDPLYYEFTCSARYAASVTDTVSSQKASVNSNVKYNVTVR